MDKHKHKQKCEKLATLVRLKEIELHTQESKLFKSTATLKKTTEEHQSVAMRLAAMKHHAALKRGVGREIQRHNYEVDVQGMEELHVIELHRKQALVDAKSTHKQELLATHRAQANVEIVSEKLKKSVLAMHLNSEAHAVLDLPFRQITDAGE